LYPGGRKLSWKCWRWRREGEADPLLGNGTRKQLGRRRRRRTGAVDALGRESREVCLME